MAAVNNQFGLTNSHEFGKTIGIKTPGMYSQSISKMLNRCGTGSTGNTNINSKTLISRTVTA
jgi:hypothetical protein